MKSIRYLVFVLAISTLVLSACGSAATPHAGGGKVEAMPVAFLGNVDSITGNQWVISGTAVMVDPSIVRDGPFGVGDRVKVEGVVNPDGSFTVSRVELPAPEDISATPQVSDDNPNEDLNDDHGNNAELNDDHGNGTELNDDHGHDASVSNDDKGTGVSQGDNSPTDNQGGSSGKDNGGKDQSGKDSGGGKGSGGGGSDNSGGGGSDN